MALKARALLRGANWGYVGLTTHRGSFHQGTTRKAKDVVLFFMLLQWLPGQMKIVELSRG